MATKIALGNPTPPEREIGKMNIPPALGVFKCGFHGHEAAASKVRESSRPATEEVWVKYWTLLATLEAIMTLPEGYESPASRPDNFLRRQVTALYPQNLNPKRK